MLAVHPEHYLVFDDVSLHHRLLRSPTQAHQPQCADSNGWAWSVRRQRRSCLRDVMDITCIACHHNETPTRSTGELLQTPRLPLLTKHQGAQAPRFTAHICSQTLFKRNVLLINRQRSWRLGCWQARARVAAILILPTTTPEDRLACHLFSPRLITAMTD